jgi:hypothetical protein
MAAFLLSIQILDYFPLFSELIGEGYNRYILVRVRVCVRARARACLPTFLSMSVSLSI